MTQKELIKLLDHDIIKLLDHDISRLYKVAIIARITKCGLKLAHDSIPPSYTGKDIINLFRHFPEWNEMKVNIKATNFNEYIKLYNINI